MSRQDPYLYVLLFVYEFKTEKESEGAELQC